MTAFVRSWVSWDLSKFLKLRKWITDATFGLLTIRDCSDWIGLSSKVRSVEHHLRRTLPQFRGWLERPIGGD